MDVFKQIEIEIQKKDNESKNFHHEKFVRNLIELIEERPERFIGEIFASDSELPNEVLKDNDGVIIKPVSYEGQTLLISPEPLHYIDLFDDVSNDQEKCRQLFKKLCKNEISLDGVDFKQVHLNHAPENNIWFNETSKHINLRPGTMKNL